MSAGATPSPATASSLANPTPSKDLGYSAANTQLLTIAVYVVALIAVITTAWSSDRLKRRAEFNMHPYLLCAVGPIITVAWPKDHWPGARYAMLFVFAASLHGMRTTSQAAGSGVLSLHRRSHLETLGAWSAETPTWRAKRRSAVQGTGRAWLS